MWVIRYGITVNATGLNANQVEMHEIVSRIRRNLKSVLEFICLTCANIANPTQNDHYIFFNYYLGNI